MAANACRQANFNYEIDIYALKLCVSIGIENGWAFRIEVTEDKKTDDMPWM